MISIDFEGAVKSWHLQTYVCFDHWSQTHQINHLSSWQFSIRDWTNSSNPTGLGQADGNVMIYRGCYKSSPFRRSGEGHSIETCGHMCRNYGFAYMMVRCVRLISICVNSLLYFYLYLRMKLWLSFCIYPIFWVLYVSR